ncbi:DUF1801 domain-containing protein [Flavihumibacter petaseus]|nr:DUF1801 domain-containing protein [Flavihumibacter petaseus]
MAGSTSSTPDQYINELPQDRQETVRRLRAAILDHLPEGFKEVMGYGMIGYVVPHSLYPDGYHVSPEQPLPFMCLAAQKNFYAVYHMGLYGDPVLLDWFRKSYAATGWKLDMGKSCIRFKDSAKIPYALISELCEKISVKDWITQYEKNLRK